MSFDWERLPAIVHRLRHEALTSLINDRDEMQTWKLRGMIAAYDEILRQPLNVEEEMLMQEQIDVGY